MKKLYVILFVTMLSCTVYSQTTWNLRGGFGVVSYENETSSNGRKFDDECPTYFGMLQCNIPVVTRFSVCPTLTVGSLFGTLDDEADDLMIFDNDLAEENIYNDEEGGEF